MQDFINQITGSAFLLICAVVWIATLILGAWIGGQRGHAGIGFLLSLFFGPLGLIIACLLPQRKNASRGNSLTAADLASDRLMMHIQQDRAKREAAAAVPPSIPLRVRRGTEELGAWTVPQIHQYLAAQNLTIEDEYYDIQARTWLPLASLPWGP